MRIAYAIRQLLEQTGGDVVGDPDQLGVRRSAAIPAKYAEKVGADYRVLAVAVVGDVALVDVVSGRSGDLTDVYDVG